MARFLEVTKVTDESVSLTLCDKDGLIRLDVFNNLRALAGEKRYDGAPFNCTGGAHIGRASFRCTSSAHARDTQVLRTNDPKTVGLEIRRLLLSLRHPDHRLDSEYNGHYGTDLMRREALQIAGICSLDNGELAPMCCCGWSEDGGIVRPTKENPHP